MTQLGGETSKACRKQLLPGALCSCARQGQHSQRSALVHVLSLCVHSPVEPNIQRPQRFQDKSTNLDRISLFLPTTQNKPKEVGFSTRPLLHFIQGDKLNTHPHDWVCILYDMMRRMPQWLKIWLDNEHALWQEVIFKNLPTICRFCSSSQHLTFECKADKFKANSPKQGANCSPPRSQETTIRAPPAS